MTTALATPAAQLMFPTGMGSLFNLRGPSVIPLSCHVFYPSDGIGTLNSSDINLYPCFPFPLLHFFLPCLFSFFFLSLFLCSLSLSLFLFSFLFFLYFFSSVLSFSPHFPFRNHQYLSDYQRSRSQHVERRRVVETGLRFSSCSDPRG
ncbi:uncharacterized protein B0H64DRAFT_130962 [Chaetomium fimeti]|uniref:Uncharacterized protein n=1 Tax=Chaetomium fimeti TaxID=1854472 RepID=A0AAE0HJK3_9PEZI|nr:hypothetical protein B0H64DRAFT_130962 [Chaetomium fimeti]